MILWFTWSTNGRSRVAFSYVRFPARSQFRLTTPIGHSETVALGRHSAELARFACGQPRKGKRVVPSMSLRVVVLFGLFNGCLAVYLGEWGVNGVPAYVWKIPAALDVLALIGARNLPRYSVEDSELRSRVGDSAVNRLIAIRRAAILADFFLLLPAVLITPLFADPSLKRSILVVCTFVLVVTLAAMTVVEVQFRALVRRSGLEFKA